MSQTLSPRWVVIGPDERDEIEQLKQCLRAAEGGEDLRLTVRDCPLTRIPPSVVLVLREAVRLLADNEEVTVLSFERPLTSTQAADLLGVSRPFVTKLMDMGRIRSHLAGRHRRVFLRDVLAYKEERDKQRR
jgi:excisionase family DNA binding protein